MAGLVKTEWNRHAAWIAVLLFALSSAPAEADVEAGIAAYQGGDFVVALREFQEAAKHDDVHALNYLGIMYAEGLGTQRDDKRAADMFYIAQTLGYPEATANLARMYAEGLGVRQDNKAALSSYRAAAKAGFKPAIIRMAEIYEKGELGEAPNAALAREWRARLQGVEDANRRSIAAQEFSLRQKCDQGGYSYAAARADSDPGERDCAALETTCQLCHGKSPAHRNRLSEHREPRGEVRP